MNKLKLAYFGTPDFSAQFLEKLLTDKEIPVEVVLVVTQKDKPVGRKQVITPSSVKVVAEKYKIPIATLSNGQIVRENDSNLTVYQFNNIDFALLYAYGEIIPTDMLTAPKHGFWNIHPSLLPKYRGASPVASAILAGDKETGVSLIQLVEKLDAGPIIAQKTVKIRPKERLPELSLRLANVGYELFCDVILNSFQDLKFTPQDDKLATFTKRFTKEDGFIEISNFKFQISNSPDKLFNLFRGLYPWPGIWSKLKIKNEELRIKITDMDLIDGKLIIKKVQLEGKKEVDFATFNKVYKVF